MSKRLPDHISGLIKYLSAPDEKANEDLAIQFFRTVFGDKFTRQKEADRSDGYLPGTFVLELKGKTSDWFSGLFQGLAYKRNLDFSVVIVAAKGFLAAWSVEDLEDSLINEVIARKGAPSAVGKHFAQAYKNEKETFQRKAIYKFPNEYLGELFLAQPSIIEKEIKSFEQVIKAKRKVRQKINIRNFTTILKQMSEFFDPGRPIRTVRAFYSMIFGWDENAILDISAKFPDQATLSGELIENLIPGKREKFKTFVESHYVEILEGENVDDFFAKYDQALDAVDPGFRIKHGIFFTDLDLSKFVMWFVKKELGDIGKNYLVIDPACGSGNLVTNWRSPLELRHKVVSEIEPELLYTVEQRMRGDKWHNGKFTVVPKISENKGLNFLDKSADDYIDTIRKYISEKGHKADKPIAFLCNPPYRSDDDQAAESVKYEIHPSILELTGRDGSAERYCCFLAQMQRICERAKDSGLPGDSLLLLFTKAAWLTKRPVFEEIRRNICSSFESVGGMLVNSKEFFDVKGKFPIAFTVWRYKGTSGNLDANRAIRLLDLTWMNRQQLAGVNWLDQKAVERECSSILGSEKSIEISLGQDTPNIKEWSGLRRFDFQREKRKSEKTDPNFKCGLPKGDSRHSRKKTLGECDGEFIGFVDDLTPCRIRRKTEGGPWFRLNNQFMDCRKTRCLSGPPDNRGFEVTNETDAKKAFVWYALGRVFASHGYPMWVDAEEMWPVNPPSRLEERLTSLSFAIGFAENECLESSFPAGNPVRAAKEIYISNPLSPLIQDSFWNQHMAGHFKNKTANIESQLVEKVTKVFALWKKTIGGKKEIYVDYDCPYFVGDKTLHVGAGLVQIRDFAKETNHVSLLEAFREMSELLKATKDEFHKLLSQKTGFNYFQVRENSTTTRIAPSHRIENSLGKSKQKGFQGVLDLRLALASRIVDKLKNSKDFNRVKFAKAFFLADMVSQQDLKTVYYREASGPLDQRALYNSKIGIEAMAQRAGLFQAEKKKGKEFDFVVYKVGPNLHKGIKLFEEQFANSKNEIDRMIELIKPMSRDYVEAVSTLYACWNDLLKSKVKINDEDIIRDFKSRWHPGKSKKFLKVEKRPPIFTEDALYKALAWMRKVGIVPSGNAAKTLPKPEREEVPF